MDGECWSEAAEIREKSCVGAGLGWAGLAGLGWAGLAGLGWAGLHCSGTLFISEGK